MFECSEVFWQIADVQQRGDGSGDGRCPKTVFEGISLHTLTTVKATGDNTGPYTTSRLLVCIVCMCVYVSLQGGPPTALAMFTSAIVGGIRWVCDVCDLCNMCM